MRKIWDDHHVSELECQVDSDIIDKDQKYKINNTFARRNMIKFIGGYVEFQVAMKIQMEMFSRQSYPCLRELPEMKL